RSGITKFKDNLYWIRLNRATAQRAVGLLHGPLQKPYLDAVRAGKSTFELEAGAYRMGSVSINKDLIGNQEIRRAPNGEVAFDAMQTELFQSLAHFSSHFVVLGENGYGQPTVVLVGDRAAAVNDFLKFFAHDGPAAQIVAR